jgi:hypothetical protein
MRSENNVLKGLSAQGTQWVLNNGNSFLVVAVSHAWIDSEVKGILQQLSQINTSLGKDCMHGLGGGSCGIMGGAESPL